ncbi:MAG: peroxide stress protein YaaA [Lachnospiraceae bacterium]|nr:peroxide stress protein YaaA [Lachnospiraceae bacterium]MDD3616613.1 peroxide stress protein YaaA [Lachnospiraceae bacterium]
MKIIISPAKKMNIDTDTYSISDLPQFLPHTEILLDYMKKLSYDEVKSLWKCNDKLAQMNYRRIQEMDLRKCLTPAICSYEGLQYQYMAPNVFSKSALEYIQNNLCILSGFYGVLKPFDGVTPYRLEMQAKVKLDGYRDLYEFWGDSLYKFVVDEQHMIINLASKEYSRCVEDYVKEEERFVTCVFGEAIDGKVVQKGTKAKMARGEMVRYMAENNVNKPEELKNFCGLNYHFSEELSSDSNYIFLQ